MAYAIGNCLQFTKSIFLLMIEPDYKWMNFIFLIYFLYFFLFLEGVMGSREVLTVYG